MNLEPVFLTTTEDYKITEPGPPLWCQSIDGKTTPVQEGRLTWFLKKDLDSGLWRVEGAGDPVLGNKVTNTETREWHGHSLFI